MTRFIEIEQNGQRGYVNVDHVALVIPTQIINTSAVIIDAQPALAITIKGSVDEAVARMEGKDTLLLEA
jgi:hypothetical protein